MLNHMFIHCVFLPESRSFLSDTKFLCHVLFLSALQ